jgi:hypothetical protein
MAAIVKLPSKSPKVIKRYCACSDLANRSGTAIKSLEAMLEALAFNRNTLRQTK